MLALVLNQTTSGAQPPPPPPPAPPSQAVGGVEHVYLVRSGRRSATTQARTSTALAKVHAGTATTGSAVEADAAAAAARGAPARAGAGSSVQGEYAAADASGWNAHAEGATNPSDEDLIVLALGIFYPELVKARIHALDRDRPAVEQARAAIKAAVHGFLSHLREHVASVARGRAHKLSKADDKDHEVTAAADAADFAPLGTAIEPQLRTVAQDAARLGLLQVHASDMDKMLSLANERARAWAADHAGVLISDIATTTRERVAELVAQAEDEGWSNDELADALTDAGVFGEARAEMIARTEAAFADVQGNLEGWKASGVVVGKEWAASAGACDICAPLDGMVVGLDEEFPDGDPPAHPRCECDLLPVLSED